MAEPVRYQSSDEDSARWLGFEFRPGDIVISTRSKSGTTWMQMICLLLIFGTPELPGPLGELSPWLDWLVEPLDSVAARLDAQAHPRCIKTHTPLDGVPLDRRVTYIVVARHPLDMAVSLYHHANNLNRTRIRQLTGQLEPSVPDPPLPPLEEWLSAWARWEGDPRAQLDSLPGVLLHVGDAWSRREEDNIVLVHYDELLGDLDGAMRRLAGRVGRPVDEERWPDLVQAATFEAMRATSVAAAPDGQGVLKDPARFFRRGGSGEGVTMLPPDERAAYETRVAAALRTRSGVMAAWDRPMSVEPGPMAPDTKNWTWVLERRCPECGFDAAAMAPESVGDLVRANGAEWTRVLAGPDASLRRRTRPDRWSPLEYACHVRDVFVLFDTRLASMLDHDDPLFANWDQDATALEARYDLADPATVSTQLTTAAERLAGAFDSVDGDMWERTGRRSDGASFTVFSLSRYLIHDPIHHIWDVACNLGPPTD